MGGGSSEKTHPNRSDPSKQGSRTDLRKSSIYWFPLPRTPLLEVLEREMEEDALQPQLPWSSPSQGACGAALEANEREAENFHEAQAA